MDVREIGSEYHYDPLRYKTNKSNKMFKFADEAYVFSGRTAIETVLQNLTGINKAFLPSYCCDSVIEPFRASNIEVEFYDVFWDDGLKIKLDIQKDIDLILWCNYFGFKQSMPSFDNFIARGGVIVEDITHSYLSSTPFHPQSQYLVASIRKWFPLICGGYCTSQANELRHKPKTEVPNKYIEKKELAMKQKSSYLKYGDATLKEQYLQNFLWSNKWLAEHYSGLKIDSISSEYLNRVDIVAVKNRRVENVSIIYEYLKKQSRFIPLFNEQDVDCPLFVPIICANKAERDEILRKLISEEIYCPVHWPKPNDSCQSNLYDLELSLICDQRYDIEDIERMMQIVCK